MGDVDAESLSGSAVTSGAVGSVAQVKGQEDIQPKQHQPLEEAMSPPRAEDEEVGYCGGVGDGVVLGIGGLDEPSPPADSANVADSTQDPADTGTRGSTPVMDTGTGGQQADHPPPGGATGTGSGTSGQQAHQAPPGAATDTGTAGQQADHPPPGGATDTGSGTSGQQAHQAPPGAATDTGTAGQQADHPPPGGDTDTGTGGQQADHPPPGGASSGTCATTNGAESSGVSNDNGVVARGLATDDSQAAVSDSPLNSDRGDSEVTASSAAEAMQVDAGVGTATGCVHLLGTPTSVPGGRTSTCVDSAVYTDAKCTLGGDVFGTVTVTSGGELPDTVTSGVEVSGTVTPGGEVSGGEVPGTVTPGGEVPGTVASDGEVPGAVASDGEVLDTVTPGGEVCDAVTSGGEVCDAVTSGGEVPSTMTPGGEVSSAVTFDGVPGAVILDGFPGAVTCGGEVLGLATEAGDIDKLATAPSAEDVAEAEGQRPRMLTPSGGEAQTIASGEEVESAKDLDCVCDDVRIPCNVFSDKNQNVSKSNQQLASVIDIAVITDDKLGSACDALDSSDARDVSETGSLHASFSALTTNSASEGLVTLESPNTESVSTMEVSPQTIPSLKELAVLSTIANAPIVAQTDGATTPGGGGANGSNYNATAVMGNGTRMVELDGDGEGMGLLYPQTCQDVRSSDIVNCKLIHTAVANDGSTQNLAKNLQHQDQQDVHPDIELDLTQAKLCVQSVSDVQTATAESQHQLDLVDESPREEVINVSINTAAVETETSLLQAEVAVDSIEYAEPVSDVLNSDTTQDVESTAEGHGSQQSINSPDLSIASSSSTSVAQPVSGSRRTIDPYSVALDDALGSNSFNANAVPTDVGTDSVCTDPVHMDAESVTTDGELLVSSPQESNVEIVSSLRDVEVATSDRIKEALPDHNEVDTEITEGESELLSDFPTNQVSNDKATMESVPRDEMNGNGGIASKEKEAVERAVGNAAGGPVEVFSDQNGLAPGHVTAIQPGEKDQSVDDKSKTGCDAVTTHVSMASKPAGRIMDASHDMCKPGSSVTVAVLPNGPAQKAGELGEKVKQGDKSSVCSATTGTAAAQTQKKTSMSGSVSSLTSIPEAALADPPPGDECDGSRLTDGSTSSNHQEAVAVIMAPPGSSVVMRKKLGVRLAPLPVVKDVQLQQQIDHEIKMRDGTTKLLAASKHPSQLLEAAKNLLTSNARMIAYMSELQRRKTAEVLHRHRKDEGTRSPCDAKVAISDIRIPLMWRDSDHFKNKGDHRRFAVFCVLKSGTQIYDTSLVTDVDSSMTDLTFDDAVIFEKMAPNFECMLEVYCHRLLDDHSVGSTPRRLKKRLSEISTSVGRSVGRRLSGLKDDPEFMANMIVGPRFEMIASATLSLSDVNDSVGIFALTTNNAASTEGGSTELPLFGNFCCRCAAQPRCMLAEVAAGSVQMKVSREGWRKQWCILGKQSLLTWASEREQKEAEEPVYDVTITSDARVRAVEEEMEMRHALQLSAWSNGRKSTFVMATESHDDRDVWLTALQQHIVDIGAWKQACDKVMDVGTLTPANRRSGFGHRARSSLYDETPWNEEDSPMTRILNRLDLEEERDSLKPLPVPSYHGMT